MVSLLPFGASGSNVNVKAALIAQHVDAGMRRASRELPGILEQVLERDPNQLRVGVDGQTGLHADDDVPIGIVGRDLGAIDLEIEPADISEW